jgi:hypothetical protein
MNSDWFIKFFIANNGKKYNRRGNIKYQEKIIKIQEKKTRTQRGVFCDCIKFAIYKN